MKISKLCCAVQNLADVTKNGTSLLTPASCRKLYRSRSTNTRINVKIYTLHRMVRRYSSGNNVAILRSRSSASDANLFSKQTKRTPKFVLHIKCIRKESHVPAEADTLHVATQYFPRRISRYTLWRSTVQGAGYQFARKINVPPSARPDRYISREILAGICSMEEILF